MTFEKEFPSMKKYGKTERGQMVGNRVISEPMWSESVIKSCCLDKKRVREVIEKFFPGGDIITFEFC